MACVLIISRLVMVIMRFRVQFVINLHEWVFQKAEIAGAADPCDQVYFFFSFPSSFFIHSGSWFGF